MHPIVIRLKDYTIRIASLRNLLAVFCLFILLIIASFLIIYFAKYSKPLRLTVSNLTDSHASISFLTTDKVSASMIVSKDKKFPFIPIKDRTKDIGDKGRVFENYYKSHYFSIDSLEPNTTYYFRIYEGFRKAHEGEFRTGDVTSKLSQPNVVYGEIFDGNNTHLQGALVYLRVSENNKNSNILSTITNNEGKWSIDLGNLRNENLNDILIPNKNALEELIIDAPGYGRQKANSDTTNDKPWPNIILR